MEKTIALRDANQTFACCVRAVEAGDEFVITRNGQPVAKLVPVTSQRVMPPEQQAAWERTQARMWNLGGKTFDRDALHERGGCGTGDPSPDGSVSGE